jgi:hypothetical protein
VPITPVSSLLAPPCIHLLATYLLTTSSLPIISGCDREERILVLRRPWPAEMNENISLASTFHPADINLAVGSQTVGQQTRPQQEYTPTRQAYLQNTPEVRSRKKIKYHLLQLRSSHIAYPDFCSRRRAMETVVHCADFMYLCYQERSLIGFGDMTIRNGKTERRWDGVG